VACVAWWHRVTAVGIAQHWHFGTYRAVGWPPEVTVEFSPAFSTSAAAKAEIVRHLRDEVASDAETLKLLLTTPERMRGLAQEWSALPDALFFHYLPWIHEVFPCAGDCIESEYANAVEMAQWLMDNGVVDVEVTGAAAEFGFAAGPPSRRSRFASHVLIPVDGPDADAGA